MSEDQIKEFFKACADIVCLQIKADAYQVLFITEDDRLLSELYNRGIKPILVFPDTNNATYMAEYKEKVIARSGVEWWNRVLAGDISELGNRIEKYRRLGYDVRLTNSANPYIEDVVAFSHYIKTPERLIPLVGVYDEE